MKNLPLSLALAAFSGAFTLQRPADWSRAVRRLYVLGPGAVVGVVSVAVLQKGSQKRRKLIAAGTVDLVTPFTAGADGGAAGNATAPSYLRAAGSPTRTPAVALAGLAVTAGATVSGVTALTLMLDDQVETWLVRRGVARPRRLMAVAAAAGSLFLDQAVDSADARKSRDAR